MKSMKTYPEKVQEQLKRIDNAAHTNTLDSGMDNEMKLLVAALRALDFTATQAAAGYLDEPGNQGPWVNIESPLALAYWDAVDGRFTGHKQPESSKPEIEDIQKQNLLARARLLPLLDEFYTTRHTSISTMLIVRGLGWGRSRLECQGTEVARLPEKMAEYPAWLRDAQAEMQAFAEFLCGKVEE